ncbi:MAG: hypothetical protein Q8R28_13650 [Dehalococcoidia bacterium]|nr:hypothetical protein [Dehalococcoidia bacterium]
MSRLRELVGQAKCLQAPQEQPFTSSAPVVGPIIVSVRRAWNWMSAKWYVRPILEQQTAFNSAVVQIITEMTTILEQQEQALSNRIQEAEEMIISTDRDHVSLVKEVARLHHRLIQTSDSASSDPSAVREAVQRLEEALDARTRTEGKDADSLL